VSRRASLLVAALGLLLVAGAPGAWYLSQPPATVGDLDRPAAETTTAATATDGPATTGSGDTAAPDPSGAAAQDRDPNAATGADAATSTTWSTTQPARAVTSVLPPTAVRIPAIGVDAPIVPVGLEPDASMEIPEDVATIGWYEPGVRPGESGSAVLAGHVDSRSQGPGAFFDLRRLDLDDVVSITHRDGVTRDWRVVARTNYGKRDLPIADIFTNRGDPQLVLITCGGEFDRTARSYADNIVVYTVPA
jgi:hypothetical protein